MKASPHDEIPVGEPIAIALFRLDDGGLQAADDPSGLPIDAEDGVIRFVVAGEGRFDDLLPGLRLQSSARFEMPAVDFDSDRSFSIRVGFYFGASPLVVILADEPVPRYISMAVVDEVIDGLDDEEPLEDFDYAGDNVRWCVVRMLRQRIRDIELTVRQALDDEHMTAADYKALREYAVRLALVERLAAELPTPTHKDYRGGVLISPDRLPKTLREVGNEAGESGARLSGLIMSQQIVLQQRQAADAERFQRLLTLVGTTVLVPGLVAAIFGANVDFPGKDSRAGFYAMLCFMVASGLASYVALSSVELARRTDQTSSTTHAHSTATLVRLGLAACASLVGGVLFLAICS